jgi:adenine-specific DNA-methyltransferase
MKSPLQKQFQALPSYLGGKRRLAPWIFKTLASVVPVETWDQKVFIDLFLGGGAISLWAKAQGFQHIRANDTSYRSQLVAHAFLKNSRITLSVADTLWLTQPLPSKPGFIEQTFCPHVFSTRHAQCLDQGFYWARQHPDPTKRALLTVLMWHLANDFVAFATSLGCSNRPFAEALDGLRDWKSINPKRFTDNSLKRLCQPAWKTLETKRTQINGGVFGGSVVAAYQEDAITLLPSLSGDILYLDPPYAGTANYEKTNQVLDSLLLGEVSANPPQVSAFSRGTEILNSLFEKAQHIPVWILSYGNQQMSLPDLMDLVKQHAAGRQVKGFAKSYRHMPHVSQSDSNQELLILAY